MTFESHQDVYETDVARGENWTMHLGDSVEVLAGMAESSVDLSVYSPPFASLYTYSPSPRDVGNNGSREQFFEHYGFIIREMLRVTKPGRNSAVHVSDLALRKARDGHMGLYDFPGDVVRAHESAGWIYYGSVLVDKNPQAQAIRTKSHALMFVTKNRDSSATRPAIGDRLLLFKKPGDNAVQIKTDVTNEEWIEWARPVWYGDDRLASVKETAAAMGLPDDHVWLKDMCDDRLGIPGPVWYGIRETNTLNERIGREDADERHICLASGSLVLTREGHIPIESVEIGAEVLTHAGRWRRVTAKRCNGLAEVIKTEAQGVADLRTTPDHKLWTRVGAADKPRQAAMATDPMWVQAHETLGSYLNLPAVPDDESELLPHECWAIGRWLGDGHRANPNRRSGKRGGTGQFVISCAYEELDEVRAGLGEMMGFIHDTGTSYQVSIRNMSAAMRSALARCGKGATGKMVPGELLGLDAVRSEQLLAGYLSADGHYVAKHDRWMASSVSRALMLGMAMVAQKARGVVVSVYAGRPERKHEIDGRMVTAKQDWIMAFRNSPGYRSSGWIGDDGAWKKVRKINDAGTVEVWDLQVDGDESFVAEGAVVHNCPLQLDFIERCVRLWSNPGETVLTPFMGIGSEVYVAQQLGRVGVGVELKKSYWSSAVAHMRSGIGLRKGKGVGVTEPAKAPKPKPASPARPSSPWDPRP